MDAPPVQYVKTSDGYNIAYSVSGSGRSFVMMPGLDYWKTERLWKSPSWRSLFESLSQRFQLIQYDSRGSGNSTRGLKSTHSCEDYVLDLEAVVDRLGLESFVLQGTLFAVHAALRYVTRHPGRVAGLVLVIPTPMEGAVGLKNWEGLYTRNWESFLQAWTRTFSPEDGEDWAKLHGEMTSQTDFILMAEAMINSSVEELLPRINTPVLILTPGILPRNPSMVDASRAYASLMPNSQLVLYEGGSWETAVANLIPAIEDFVGSLPPPSERPSVPGAAADFSNQLSEREHEVLRLLAQGKSNPEIAKALFITRNTVQNHVSSILIKTNLGNRTEAALYAREHGLI